MTVDAPPADLPVLDDPAVPAADVLGAGAGAVLQAAVEPLGITVERVTPVQTTYHPGRSLTVRHDVALRGADGARWTESMVLASGRRPPKGSLVLEDGTDRLVVWVLPNDPWLPGLAPALDPAVVAGLLGEVGLDAPADRIRTRLVAYRPGRRAVVEVTGPGVRAFVKVVPPRSVEALHRRHERLAGPTPAPHSLGWSAEHGLVVLQALPGRTLRDALLARFPVPGPDAVLAVLDRLPALTPDEVEGAPAADWRGHEFAGILAAVAPELAPRVQALAESLAPFEAEANELPVVPVHGDLYEAQLLVDGGRITGLLDVDTFGAGRRIDDLATAIGHLSVLALGSLRRADIERYASRLLDGFDRTVDPALLRAAVAAVVLGLATGSFRVLEPNWRLHTERRVALAEAWLDSAHSARAAG